MGGGADPDFLGLGGYQSSGSGASSSESSGSESDSGSVDSAELRAAEAAARLRDYGAQQQQQQQQQKPSAALPSALDAFTEVTGKPAFLDPEATRPLAVSRAHGLAGGPGGSAAAAAATQQRKQGKKGRRPAEGEEFDIAQLAPKVKGQQQQDDKRGPPGAVIEGKAKRYKQEEGPEATQQYTAAQIAMMGGNADHLGDGGGDSRPNRGPATKPMPVTDFLDKGLGGAQLPRKQQDRKDREKEKRTRGQSTHSVWKSEQEMLLRQQYD